MRKDVEFNAEGVTLRGWLFADSAAPGPAVVMAPGFASVKEGHCGRYAEVFAAAGLRVLLFDNRNFGASDGEPRQEADPIQQVRDFRHAITFAGTRPEVDKGRIGVWGSSYSGGHAIVVAAIDRRVRCVVSSVPTISGWEGSRRRIHPDHYAALAAQFDADREARFAGKPPAMIAVVANDAAVPCVLPGPEAFEALLGERAPAREAWVNAATVRSSEMAIEYDPGAYIGRISPTPLMMIVASHDTQVPTDLALRAYEAALGPKKLVIVPEATSQPTRRTSRLRAPPRGLAHRASGRGQGRVRLQAWLDLAEQTLRGRRRRTEG